VFFLLWDASALAKRYVPEVGQQTVNALFAQVPRAQLITSIVSYSETYAALLRMYNRGVLDAATVAVARSALRAEVIDDPDLGVLAVDFDDVLGGIDLISRHNLNSSDASVLTAFLRYARSQPASIESVLVSSDQRMLRAARAEGLQTLDPEVFPAVDVPIFLASL
jgi:uncharacterized protein